MMTCRLAVKEAAEWVILELFSSRLGAFKKMNFRGMT
jgi:hypothetical protein